MLTVVGVHKLLFRRVVINNNKNKITKLLSCRQHKHELSNPLHSPDNVGDILCQILSKSTNTNQMQPGNFVVDGLFNSEYWTRKIRSVLHYPNGLYAAVKILDVWFYY